MNSRIRFDWPPAWFWLIPAVAAALRMLPVVWLQVVPAPEGAAYVGISYLPKDFLSYVAFIRQASADWSLLLFDPYTTDPQTPRFILLYHSMVGIVGSVVGLSPLTAFECSRIPLIFLLFATLWWFLQPLLPDRSTRVWAVVLAAFAGGLEGWAHLAAPYLPENLAQPLWETWNLYGWNLFASLFNPLWLAALIPALVIIRMILLRGQRRELTIVPGALFVLLYCIHPYTAIGVLAIVAAVPVVELLSGQRPDWRDHGRRAAVLGSALIVIVVINFWQAGDPVFKASAAGIWGPQALSVFWYPLTLGVTGVLALVGARLGVLPQEFRPVVYGWLVAVVLLHASPVINGYKFVMLLHVPLCILAAPVAADFFSRSMRGEVRGRSLAVLAGVGLFAGVILQSIEAVQETVAENLISADEKRVVDALSQMPAGNALVPPRLGNIVPAFGPHRVWVGHWFLTPDFHGRSAAFERLVSDPALHQHLSDLVVDQGIRYLVVPAVYGDGIAGSLHAMVVQRLRYGSLDLLVLR